MPPKAKFSREQIIGAALEIVREEGAKALTARSLGEKLGSSARPVFTVFSGMDEVKDCVVAAAKAVYKGYLDEGLKMTPPFKGAGIMYINFARREPKLFQLLFMTEHSAPLGYETLFTGIDDNADDIARSIVEFYGISRGDALNLYFHLGVYAHGIASLIATGVADFSDEQVSASLTEVFAGVLRQIKEGKRLW